MAPAHPEYQSRFQESGLIGRPFTIIDFYHTPAHYTLHADAHEDAAKAAVERQAGREGTGRELVMMKRIQNSIVCALVLSRRHTVYCTEKGHKTHSRLTKITRKNKKGEGGKRRFGRHTDVAAITLHQNTLSRIQKYDLASERNTKSGPLREHRGTRYLATEKGGFRAAISL